MVFVGCGPSAASTPLHAAVRDGNHPAVRRHIAAHTDLNAKVKADAAKAASASAGQDKGGRRLIDGGLGVSDVLDSQ